MGKRKSLHTNLADVKNDAICVTKKRTHTFALPALGVSVRSARSVR